MRRILQRGPPFQPKVHAATPGLRTVVQEAKDDAFIKDHVLGNRNHVEMARLAEWLQACTDVVATDLKKSRIPKFCKVLDSTAFKDAGSAVSEARSLVGVALAFDLILKVRPELKTVEDRLGSVAAVKKTLNAFGLSISAAAEDRLTIFVSSGPAAA